MSSETTQEEVKDDPEEDEEEEEEEMEGERQQNELADTGSSKKLEKFMPTNNIHTLEDQEEKQILQDQVNDSYIAASPLQT